MKVYIVKGNTCGYESSYEWIHRVYSKKESAEFQVLELKEILLQCGYSEEGWKARGYYSMNCEKFAELTGDDRINCHEFGVDFHVEEHEVICED